MFRVSQGEPSGTQGRRVSASGKGNGSAHGSDEGSDADRASDATRSSDRSKIGSMKPPPPLFCEYAASLMEAKIQTARIRSAAGRRKWEEILRNRPIPAFGTLRVDQLTHDGPMRESGLLFPSTRGTIRFTASLQKPFAAAARIAGIKKQLSARAMRRTFQDITRAAEVNSVVKRSISGHATEAMEGWYSTVAPDEQRAGLAKVVRLLDHKASVAKLPSPLRR